MRVEPYLFFEGRCEEALDFYKRVLGAEIGMVMRFKDNPEPAQPGMCPPNADDKIMHAAFKVGETTVMASDGRCSGQPNFQGITLSINVKNDDEAKKLFGVLGEGGQVQMPLTKTFFSSSFGIVADRFGVSWMIIVYP